MAPLPLAAAALILALTGGLFPPASAVEQPEPPAQVDAPVPVLAWASCEEDLGEGVECASAAVPLDYDDPTGATVILDLARRVATDPVNRIGTLFINPGGPGGSSRLFVQQFGAFVPDDVTARFDIVGIDPRGIGPSAAMECRTDEKSPPFPRAWFPRSEREVRQQIRYDSWQRRACLDEPSPIVDHMTTADTARDMDLIRQAVGEEQLSYYGISYGSQLGSTYAAMFPGRIRSMILDGVLDPEEWTTGHGDAATRPFSERLASGYGAWQSLTAAFAECDRVRQLRCPLAGRASETWNDIIRRLRRGPFEDRHGTVLTYDALVGSTVSFLYAPGSIRYLMRSLKQTHRVMFGRDRRRQIRVLTPGAAQRRIVDRRGIPGPYAPSSLPGYARHSNSFAGVACADSDNPADERVWVAAGKRADRVSPWFGAYWTWASSVCASWPESTKEDRFTGPFATTTSAPVLVVGNTYDPATPLHGARAVNRLIDGSRLLVMDGWGHGALGSGACIEEAYGAYLVAGTLPASGTVCRPDSQLFPR